MTQKGFEKEIRYQAMLSICRAMLESGVISMDEFRSAERLLREKYSNDKYRRTVWQCNARFVKETGCQAPHLSEPMIEQKFLAAFNQLLAQRDFIADDMQAIIRQLTNTAELDAEKEALQVEMGIVSERIRQVVSQNASAALDQEEYTWNSL